MPAPFGFSVGDFVTVIQLTGKIISALKDVGGSSSEYQHAVIVLESLKRLLEKVTQLIITAENKVQVNALRGLALACEPCLQEFHRKLKSYEASIGPFAPKGRLKGTYHKVKWAFLGSEEFSQFRKFIAMKVLCLSLLLSMHIFESTSKRDAEEQAGRFSLVDEITKIRESMERLELRNQQGVPKLDYQASLQPIQDKVENIAERLESNLPPIIDFLGSFQRETKNALQRIIQTNMQIYALLLASLSSPSTGPSMPSDFIVFEDALGRTISLPYQWFRHWETFEGLLRAKFKGVPGETKVLEGQYHLIETKDPLAGRAVPTPELRRATNRIGTSPNVSNMYYPSRERFQGQTRRLTVLTEDDKVMWSQSTEDLEVFGARPSPKDPEETAAILALLEPADTTTANDDFMTLNSATEAAPRTEKPPTSPKLTIGPVVQKLVAETIQISDDLPSDFQTPLDMWLAQTELVGLDPNVIADTPLSDMTGRDEEASEIEHFKRVHIKQWNKNPDGGNDTGKVAVDPKWSAEIDEAIYHRNISDRFPLLPSWLADRLAKLNVKRAKRLPRAYYAQASSSHDGDGADLDYHLPYFAIDLQHMNCYFCDKALSTTDGFIAHVGQHLERIAFAVLAKPYQKWHFYDDLASEWSSASPVKLSPEIGRLVSNNSVATVKQLLKDGILTKTLCGNSAIWLASQHGHELIVWLLIQYGFDVNERDQFYGGRTALHHAAEAGHAPVVKILWGAYPKRGCLDDLHSAWIAAAEKGHSECLRVLKAIFEEVYSGNRSTPVFHPSYVAQWVCDGVEAAIDKGMQKSFEEVTAYHWSPPTFTDEIRSKAASRTIYWVWLSLRNSSLSHLILSSPWLERDWLPTHLSFPDGLTDEFVKETSNPVLKILNLSADKYQGTRDSTESDVDHLQILLKQHPELIQLIYLDLARHGLRKSLLVLLQRDLRPHPRTLSTLVQHHYSDSVEYLLQNFLSHFRETDRVEALDFAVQLNKLRVIEALIKAGALPTSPSAAADRLLSTCIRYKNEVLLEKLLDQPSPPFSAVTIADANRRIKLFRALEVMRNRLLSRIAPTRD
ncbi:hypothetical protein AYL99_03788 [Fonsecaea erecta]|uniref:C2H2-type domain-containing protein n=1 Tax=Fonsecaea erecta TaxID=1367422 RepID=A0A178ZRG3_9EURO|nr:hypothetical protein AYL99_03788 [Fonsecaea erecta]OAP61585.1 hypothetical protein AYL99_03788 [Fonsecaea erecta]